jgi:hydrogenase maturation protein HypF
VYRLASAHGLGGFVRNDARGVLLEIEGETVAVDRFLARIAAEAPPLALVDEITTETVRLRGDRLFAIAPSHNGSHSDVPVAPDSATCDDCLAELFDPSDRRYRYPFITCTNCGPRFTIVTGVPYDRAMTTMAGFAMCDACRAEYDDPADRRFHAEPIACPECGPRLQLLDPRGRDEDAAAADLLRSGSIVAVKGIGGYHLACLAGDERAVATLRARKHRADKPFAIMVRSFDEARRFVHLTDGDARALLSPARPIVVAPRRDGAPVAASVAPHSRELGVMLPYAPLHHLLLADVGEPLVMTSGNRSDEPIVYRDEEVLERLGGIADFLLVHDRPIHIRADDSVVRDGLVTRRSRGHVPATLRLPVPARNPILAMGADLKSAFCLASGPTAWVGHHIGDLADAGAFVSFAEGVAHFERVFRVTPELVAHDLHPGYHSTALALEREGVELVAVQHHHAHLAACLAEHAHIGPAVGAIFDGTGYGTDGTIWGGEFLVGDLTGFHRAGHLAPVALPGGERAVSEPWRMACAWLDTDDPPHWLARPMWSAVTALTRREGEAAPTTTSAGRLFDAVAAICRVRDEVTYEGQAAIELEAICDRTDTGTMPFTLTEDDGRVIIDPRSGLVAMVEALESGATPGAVAMRFHNSFAEAAAATCVVVAARHGIDTVVLSGGVFQNTLLRNRTREQVERSGLRVLVPRLLPLNDGGIAFGQAAIAAARSAA